VRPITTSAEVKIIAASTMTTAIPRSVSRQSAGVAVGWTIVHGGVAVVHGLSMERWECGTETVIALISIPFLKGIELTLIERTFDLYRIFTTVPRTFVQIFEVCREVANHLPLTVPAGEMRNDAEDRQHARTNV
jgi:hypothetical protein